MASEVEIRDTPARDTWIGKHVRKPFKCKVATTHNQTTWRKFKSWTLWLIIDAKYQLGLGTCKLHTFATVLLKDNTQKSEWTVFTFSRVTEELAKFPNELFACYTPVFRNFPKNFVKMKLKNCSKNNWLSCLRLNNWYRWKTHSTICEFFNESMST